ncbi:aryl-sulfate sulfotransferase [Halocatena marina]|uniref:aryl-sulfate sulfotransferase n=2 Tax=Halocatena marina TaxID=2934937 RepID=UPI0022255779|nr:aryl-sulfate sulfotransferase [Halocatena marina]
MIGKRPSISKKSIARLLVGLMILSLLTPIALAAMSHTNAKVASNDNLRKTAQNVTFISTQGGSLHVYDHAGSLVAVHTDSKEVIWEHDKYRRYMDIDPIGQNRILFVAGERDGDDFQRVAVLMNWRNGTVLEKFNVSKDLHDIDRLGPHRYAVADKHHNRIYVYDSQTNKTTWEYDLESHFSPSAGRGIKSADYSHLNDIDLADNGSSFVISPRNFDRVVQIDRKSKDIEWTLGKEDAYDILNEQHNPLILQQEPLTVLVADSANDRIVEYQRKNGEWEIVWGYRDGLNWPRDADRLPNGNTLIGDSLNDRAIVVTPDRKVVWEFQIERGVYDVERLPYGDEPVGPTMASQQDKFDGTIQSDRQQASNSIISQLDKSYKKTFQIVTWILPDWITLKEYGYFLSSTLLVVGWATTEFVLAFPANKFRRNGSITKVRSTIQNLRLDKMRSIFGIIGVIVGLGLIALLPISGSETTLYLGLGTLSLALGSSACDFFRTVLPNRVVVVLKGSVFTGTLAVALVLLALSMVRSEFLLQASMAFLLLLATLDVL